MAETCVYHAGGQPACDQPATHVVLRPTWQAGVWVPTLVEPDLTVQPDDARPGVHFADPSPEFCALHAASVAARRNQTARQAQIRRTSRRCTVCDEPMAGAFFDVAGVGACCWSCTQAAAQVDELAPRRGRKRAGGRR